MKKRRLLSIVLSLCMVLALMPQMVFAETIGGLTLEPAVPGTCYLADFTRSGQEVPSDYDRDNRVEYLSIANGTMIIEGNKSLYYHDEIHGLAVFNDNCFYISVAGNAEISFVLCAYSNGGKLNASVDTDKGELNTESIALKGSEDGEVNTFYYTGEAATIRVRISGCTGESYLHGIRVNNIDKTVTFDSNGGSSVPEQKVVDGDKVTEPTAPTREGYKFTGWYMDEELKTPYDFGSEVKENITLYAGWDEEKITMTVPFTTIVELGGNASPGKTTFNLKVVDSQGKELPLNDYNVKIAASVETDGAGDYNGNLTFTGTASAILRMFDNEHDEYGYIYVKQADINDSNWTVDRAVWGLFHRDAVVALSEGEEDPSPILIFPAENNGISYSVKDGENNVNKMTFINTYTKSTTNPSDTEGTTNGDSDNADKNAKTGDDTNLALWLALMLLSGAGITGVTVYTRRKRTNE